MSKEPPDPVLKKFQNMKEPAGSGLNQRTVDSTKNHEEPTVFMKEQTVLSGGGGGPVICENLKEPSVFMMKEQAVLSGVGGRAVLGLFHKF